MTSLCSVWASLKNSDMDTNEILVSLENHPEKRADLRMLLIDRINDMIVGDFTALTYLLYRVDVNEKQLRKLLEENKETFAAAIIADLVIERQLEKKKLREKYKSDSDNIPDEERW
jgi:hypothetical protein